MAGFQFNQEGDGPTEWIYSIENNNDSVTVVFDTDDQISVEGDGTRLKNILLLWANIPSNIKISGSSGLILFNLEWREWNDDARILRQHIESHGIPADDNIPDHYRFSRDRMFHDYMFRTKSHWKIDVQIAEQHIRSWFDKNCYMNIPEVSFFFDLERHIFEIHGTIPDEISIETLANGLSEAMAQICPSKFYDDESGSRCPQTCDECTICTLNLVDSLYPYTKAGEVVKFTKANFKALVDGGGNVEWKSLAPTTPIEEIMDVALKDANYSVLPQYQAYDINHKYRIDFMIETGTKYRMAIECDGLQYHAKPKQYINDRKRDRYLQSKNILMMRFASVEIFNELNMCIE